MYCWPSISALLGVSLVITRRVVKADYGWALGLLNVLIIIEHRSYTCCHNFSLQVFAIEFVDFAIEFVSFAIEFVPFAIEFVGFAVKFVRNKNARE